MNLKKWYSLQRYQQYEILASTVLFLIGIIVFNVWMFT